MDEPHHHGRRTSEMIYPDEPAENQMKAELVTPGSKTGRAYTRDASKYGPVQCKRQSDEKCLCFDSAHGVGDRNGGWRVSDDGK